MATFGLHCPDMDVLEPSLGGEGKKSVDIPVAPEKQHARKTMVLIARWDKRKR